MGRVIGFMKLIWWNSLLFCLQPFTEFWTSIVSFDCSDVSFVFCVMSMRLFSILSSVFCLLFYFVCVEACLCICICICAWVFMFWCFLFMWVKQIPLWWWLSIWNKLENILIVFQITFCHPFVFDLISMSLYFQHTLNIYQYVS